MTNYYDQYWTKEGKTWSPSEGTLLPIEEKLIVPHLREGAMLLDYGCGDGQRYGKIIAARGVKYVGYDISQQAVAQARNSGLDVSLLVDGSRTNLADGSCDVALCFEVLEHLMEPELAVKEILRTLRTSGVAIFSVPNAGSWISRFEFLLTGFLNPGGSPLTSRKAPWRDPHIRFFTPRLLERILRESGFGEVRISGSDFSLKNMPYLYRARLLGPIAHLVSRPFRSLGYLLPGLFSGRVYATAIK